MSDLKTKTVAEPEVQHLGQFIGGQTVAPLEGRYLDDQNPATGSLLARIPAGTVRDVDAAVASAKAAFPQWSATPVTKRADLLDAMADRIEERLDLFASLESQDTGKPVGLAARMDVPRAVANFRFFAGAVRHDETAFQMMDGALNYTLRKALGVVGLITPWNLPIYLLSWKVAPALAMGNTVVAKPSEFTPLTADLLGQVAAEVGLPDGVLNIVHGTGPDAGAPLVAHPDVKAISFTGGTATGRAVAASAAPMFKKLSLELGGKNPTLVFADADLDAAVEGTFRAGFTNSGQICLCGSRVLVEASAFDTFVGRLQERVEAAVLGDPADPATELGSLISLAHREKVESYLQAARDEGATFVTGGGRPSLGASFDGGAFVEPTIITGLRQDSRCVQEEIFGPVVSVQPFTGVAEAVRLANDVPYGLAASVWTKDVDKAHRVSAELDSGMVWVNTWLLRDLRVPFGGMKASGVGREGGRYSLEFFSEARNVCLKLGDVQDPPAPGSHGAS